MQKQILFSHIFLLSFLILFPTKNVFAKEAIFLEPISSPIDPDTVEITIQNPLDTLFEYKLSAPLSSRNMLESRACPDGLFPTKEGSLGSGEQRTITPNSFLINNNDYCIYKLTLTSEPNNIYQTQFVSLIGDNVSIPSDIQTLVTRINLAYRTADITLFNPSTRSETIAIEFIRKSQQSASLVEHTPITVEIGPFEEKCLSIQFQRIYLSQYSAVVTIRDPETFQSLQSYNKIYKKSPRKTASYAENNPTTKSYQLYFGIGILFITFGLWLVVLSALHKYTHKTDNDSIK